MSSSTTARLQLTPPKPQSPHYLCNISPLSNFMMFWRLTPSFIGWVPNVVFNFVSSGGGLKPSGTHIASTCSQKVPRLDSIQALQWIRLDNDQLDAHLLYFTIRPLQSSTCFEHYMLIIRRLKCIDAASGIVLSVSGRPVHRLRENCRAVLSQPDAASIQFNLLTMSM